MANDDDLRKNLSRTGMADGGEVVRGKLAQRALDAVGARAMTLDHTIVVGEDFDPSAPEDQALYAHERLHQRESGGAEAHHGDHDAEEQEARRVEAMVLQRRRDGASLEDAMAGTHDPEHAGADQPAPGEVDPLQAYRHLRAQGMSHEAIVRTLARFVLDELWREGEEAGLRGGRS